MPLLCLRQSDERSFGTKLIQTAQLVSNSLDDGDCPKSPKISNIPLLSLSGVNKMIQARVEVMHRTEPTFEVLPKRWVVERNACMVQPLSSSQQGL